MHGLPIGWREVKLQQKIGLWRPVQSDPPPVDECILFAKEWSDCGWLIDTGQVCMKTGKCQRKSHTVGFEYFEPDYWMLYDDLTNALESANYPNPVYVHKETWISKLFKKKA